MIRIVLAEDQKLLRGAMAKLLQMEDDLEVVAEAADGEEAIRVIEKWQPDVCLLDIEIPKLTGLEVAERIKKQRITSKIMIVTTFSRPGYLQKAMDIGVNGYLLKDDPIDELVGAIRKVMSGNRVISPDLAVTLFHKEENPLTEGEQTILQLIKQGKTTEEIASILFFTKGTVRNYVSSTIQKLEVETRHQAIQKAIEKGWI